MSAPTFRRNVQIENKLWFIRGVNVCCCIQVGKIFIKIIYTYVFITVYCLGASGSVVVKALCCKPEVEGSIPDEANF
jgi:hypothetical protein